jgi:hypothetical protein
MTRQVIVPIRWRALIAAAVCVVSHAQKVESNPAACVLRATEDQSRGTPVIFGSASAVPEIRLRLVDQAAGRAITAADVNVNYYWKWIEYPYPEHEWGAWSDARDWVQCSIQSKGEVVIPAFTVKPRGWYAGKYTKFPWLRKPQFDRIEIVFEFGHCAPRLIIKAGDIRRFDGKSALVQLPCAGRADVRFSDSDVASGNKVGR